LTMDPFDPEAQKLIAEEIRCVVFTNLLRILPLYMYHWWFRVIIRMCNVGVKSVILESVNFCSPSG